MNPRELLSQKIVKETENFEVGLEGAVIFERRLERLLSKYAIGRWVPVSERLPDTGERTYWDGIVLQDGDVEIGTFGDDSFRPESTNITHWLELDIPEVSQ